MILYSNGCKPSVAGIYHILQPEDAIAIAAHLKQVAAVAGGLEALEATMAMATATTIWLPALGYGVG